VFVEDQGNEQDREQADHSRAPVSRRSFVVSVAAAGAAATAARTLPGRSAVPGAAGAGPGRAQPSTCGSLKHVKPPLSNGELVEAAFVSADEWWAVGDQGAALKATQTLIMQFDGSEWSVVSSPNEGGTTVNNGLNGVSMISGAGWAVGYYQPSGTYQPLAMQWDGTQWSLNMPATLPSDSVFTGVDTMADGSAWAVGFQTATTGARSTLIEYVSGGTWTQVASPNMAGSTDNTLMAISGTDATGLWAVGYWLGPSGLQPLVLCYDTTQSSPSWAQVSGVPPVGAIDTVLTAVDVQSATDVWAVGYYNDGAADQPLALHWDGTTWSSSTVPGVGLLRSVTELASGNVWAAGSYYNATDLCYKTLVVYFNGTAWETVDSYDSLTADDQLIGLAANTTGSMITVVGRLGDNPLIEQASCPSGPVSPATRTPPAPPSAPTPPGVGPNPSPPPNTPPATTAIPITITDEASAAGISTSPDWSFSAAVADFTGDGWPDLFISHHWHPANLYLNNQDGTFTGSDVSYFSSILDRHDCQPADFNQDGLMDIFSSVGADRGTVLKCNGLFLQQSDGTFVNEGYQWNICDAAGRGRFCAVLDANNDGYPDIFYGTDPRRADGLPSINRFYLNTGQGSFIDSPSMGLNLNFGAQSVRTVDYNSDGWPDLLICGYTGGLRLFENNQGQGFTDVSSILPASMNAVDAFMVDVNHDNFPDLIVLTRNAVTVSLQNADGTFATPKTVLKNIKSGTALAVGDVNGDNNPDIYVVCGRAAGENAQDYLLLGNPTGGFAQTTIPQTTVGAGESAWPVDYNNSGLTSFLVLNGAVPYSGPVQLLTPVPQDGDS
jgi:FG-GAP-like repeat